MLIARRAITFGLIALLCVIVAACGDYGDAPTPTPSPTAPAITPSPTLQPTATPTPLIDTDVPPDRDRVDLARRFLGLPDDAPVVARSESFGHQVGDSAVFTLLDLDIPAPYEITASVRAVSDNAYFFVQDGRAYSESSLARIVDDFETLIWPAVTGTFGEPATPGVDGDPRITILHADLRGAGGYASGSDGYPRSIAPLSNEREVIYIDAENLSVPGRLYNGLVAHELQHLIHDAYDDGEESWVNEGLSQVASHLVGAGGEWLGTFLAQPDLQLNHWPSSGDTIAHYAASELFFTYLLDHYGGRENAYSLVSEPADGIEGVDAYLEDFGATFEQVFADWTVANWLGASSGPYSHPNLTARTSVATSAANDGEGAVRQFAADYLSVPNGAGDVLTFQGDTQVSVGVPEFDGAFYWSNRGDSIDSRLTRTVDLGTVDTATLTFDSWYDIEAGWDYAYVAASADDGRTWTTLAGQTTTTDDPAGLSYGHGFSGRSGGWIGESVDLSDYAGGEIMLRFEYITDDAANDAGFAVDNIAIPEIGFLDDGTDGGWHREGFLRIDGPLEQTWSLRLISPDGAVQPIPVSDDGTSQVLLGGGPATIVVAATTRGTTEPASYSWSFSQ